MREGLEVTGVTLGAILIMMLVPIGVIANTQGFEWGIEVDDVFYFNQRLTSVGDYPSEDIDDLVYFEINSIPALPVAILEFSDIPSVDFSQYYMNGTPSYSMYIPINLVIPINNWELLTTIFLDSAVTPEDNTTMLDTESEWGFVLEMAFDNGGAEYYYNYTIMYLKVDGVLSLVEMSTSMTYEDTTMSSTLITIRDLGAPILSHPADIEYNEGELSNSIQWTFDDETPASYSIHRDGILLYDETLEPDDESIYLDVDGLSYGTHTFEIVLEDKFTQTASDTVLVRVRDIDAPEIEGLEDFSFPEGEENHTIEWQLSDNNPFYYEIYDNGVLIDSAEWFSPSKIVEYDLEGASAGSHNYTIVAYDKAGNPSSHSVQVFIESSLLGLLFDPRMLITVGSLAVILVLGGLIIKDRRANA